MPVRLLMMPCTWQCSGSATPFDDVAPAGLNFASVICVGVTGNLVSVARPAQAVAGSDGAAARLACPPRPAMDAPTRMYPSAGTGRRRRCRLFMSCLSRVLRPRPLLPRLLEIPPIRRRLVLLGGHQQAFSAQEIVLLADDDLVVALGAKRLAP